MIFAAIKTYKDLRDGTKDPTGFGRDLALDVIKAPLVLFSIIGLVGVAFFFILGFTELILPSLGFFKFVFFISFFVFLIVEVVTWTMFLKIKKLLEKAKKSVDARVVKETKIEEVHIVDAK